MTLKSGVAVMGCGDYFVPTRAFGYTWIPKADVKLDFAPAPKRGKFHRSY
jgi:hypothetical protein